MGPPGGSNAQTSNEAWSYCVYVGVPTRSHGSGTKPFCSSSTRHTAAPDVGVRHRTSVELLAISGRSTVAPPGTLLKRQTACGR